jgi:hypothetical protein
VKSKSKIIEKALAEIGVKATVVEKTVGKTRLCRLFVVLPAALGLWHDERQEWIWRITCEVLPDARRIVAIYTFGDTKSRDKEIARFRRIYRRPA